MLKDHKNLNLEGMTLPTSVHAYFDCKLSFDIEGGESNRLFLVITASIKGDNSKKPEMFQNFLGYFMIIIISSLKLGGQRCRY